MDKHEALDWFLRRRSMTLDDKCQAAEDIAIECIMRAIDGDWISVKDRMPEKQTPVLVYVPPYSDEDEEYIGHVAMSYYTHSARGGYWAGTDGTTYGAIGIIHEPTHWMPLPEPPKEEEHADMGRDDP